MIGRRGGNVCIAIGCKNSTSMKGKRFYRIPREEDIGRIWLTRARRFELLTLKPDVWYKNHRLCCDHFHPSQFFASGRLVWRALPTRFQDMAYPLDIAPITAMELSEVNAVPLETVLQWDSMKGMHAHAGTGLDEQGEISLKMFSDLGIVWNPLMDHGASSYGSEPYTPSHSSTDWEQVTWLPGGYRIDLRADSFQKCRQDLVRNAIYHIGLDVVKLIHSSHKEKTSIFLRFPLGCRWGGAGRGSPFNLQWDTLSLAAREEAGTSKEGTEYVAELSKQSLPSNVNQTVLISTPTSGGDGCEENVIVEDLCAEVVKTEVEWACEMDAGPMLATAILPTVDRSPAASREEKASDATDGDAPAPAKKPKREKKEDGSSATPTRRSSRVILPKYPSPQVGNASSVVESTSSHVGSTSSHFGSTSSHVGSHVEEQDTDSMEESFQESTEEESVLERLCRLCLQELEDFTYIFEFDDIHRFNVGDVIIDLMGMDLNPDDGYPSKICNDCLEELARFRRFKGKCFQSRSRLKEMIQAPTYSDVDFEHAAFPSVAGERAAGEVPLQSETAEEPRIKQETNLLMSFHQSESGNDSSQKQDLQRVDKVIVKEEIMSCEPPSVEKMTFHEELIIPSEPTSADTVTVNEGLMMPYEPTSVDKVTVNQELLMPCQPTSVDKATVNELMMPCQPTSVDKVTVNELMMPCQPTSVDKVTVNELMMTCQPTSVDKVTVKEEFMSPEPTGVTNVWSDSGEGTARESITKLQDEHNPLEEPNVPCPLVAAEGLSVSVKEEVFSEDEELTENVGGLGGKGRMAR